MKTSPETINLLINAAVVALLIAFAFLLIKLLVVINDAKIQPSRQGNRGRRGVSNGNSKLERKLLAMLNGDRAGAMRLLNGAKRMYPGKSNDWYYEKVIGDLERDRR